MATINTTTRAKTIKTLSRDLRIMCPERNSASCKKYESSHHLITKIFTHIPESIRERFSTDMLSTQPQTHAWWKTIMDVGSIFCVSMVDLAVTPKPFRVCVSKYHAQGIMKLTRGISAILKTTTPWCSGVSSVILPKCALTTWLPYKNGISPLGFIQTWSL
jgi:hypothetical protein